MNYQTWIIFLVHVNYIMMIYNYRYCHYFESFVTFGDFKSLKEGIWSLKKKTYSYISSVPIPKTFIYFLYENHTRSYVVKLFSQYPTHSYISYAKIAPDQILCSYS